MAQENPLKKRFLVIVNPNQGQIALETKVTQADASLPSEVGSSPQVLQFQPSVTRNLPGEPSTVPASPTSQPCPSVHPHSVDRMAHTPPPPPPANPNLQRANLSPPTTSTEKTAASTPDSSTSETAAQPPVSYEMHTEGPLTYFNYYFEDADFSTASSENRRSPKPSKVTVGLVGAGVVAATVASGLFIRDALKPVEPPQDNQPINAKTQQKTTNSLRPSTTAPERLTTPRSQTAPKAASQTQSRPATAATLKKSSLPKAPLVLPDAPPSLEGTTLLSEAPEAVALSPSPARVVVAKQPATKLPLPTVRVRETAQVPSNPDSLLSVQQATIRQKRVAAIATPEMLPVRSSAANSPLQAPDSNTDSFPASTAFPPSLESPANISSASAIATDSEPSSNAANEQQPEQLQVEENSLVSSGAVTTASGQRSVNLQPLFPPPQQSLTAESGAPQQVMTQNSEEISERDRADLPASPLEIEASPVTNAVNRSSTTDSEATRQPRIQDYLVLPQQLPSDKPISLLPLTQQAAEEAIKTDRFGSFTVRPVNTQDYQKEWMASNPAVEDSAIALGFPAYGFIDYQRHVIVVLQEPNKDMTQVQKPLPSVRSQKQIPSLQSRNPVIPPSQLIAKQ